MSMYRLPAENPMPAFVKNSLLSSSAVCNESVFTLSFPGCVFLDFCLLTVGSLTINSMGQIECSAKMFMGFCQELQQDKA